VDSNTDTAAKRSSIAWGASGFGGFDIGIVVVVVVVVAGDRDSRLVFLLDGDMLPMVIDSMCCDVMVCDVMICDVM